MDRPGTVRWWPAALVVGAGALLLAWIWLFDRPHRQSQILGTLAVLILVGLLLIVWLVFFSRLRFAVRAMALAAILAIALLVGSMLEVRGVSGDVLPILDWRWSSRPGVGQAAPFEPGRDDATQGPFDYPRFLGARTDGVVHGVRLGRDWEGSPPTAVWRQPIGEGWSGFAIAGDFAVTQEQHGGEERVTAYDLRSGRLRWSHADAVRFENPLGGVGPRATPAIDGLRVFTFGATGILNALDLETGRRLWTRRVLEENGTAMPTYGVSASPLVVDGLVVVCAGGPGGKSLVAYRAADGEPVWAGGDDPAAYSSPMWVDLAGTPQIVVLNQRRLVGHDPSDGRVLWAYDWPAETEKVSQPVVLPDDRLFVSTGYGVGGKMLKLTREATGVVAVELVWETRDLKAKFTNIVYRDGYLYGLDDGILVCLDAATGRRRWKRGRYGHGQVLLVDDLVLILAERGTVALVEATPEAYRELGWFPAISGKTWNHPALAGDLLLVRNDREAAAYRLPTKP